MPALKDPDLEQRPGGLANFRTSNSEIFDKITMEKQLKEQKDGWDEQKKVAMGASFGKSRPKYQI